MYQYEYDILLPKNSYLEFITINYVVKFGGNVCFGKKLRANYRISSKKN